MFDMLIRKNLILLVTISSASDYYTNKRKRGPRRRKGVHKRKKKKCRKRRDDTWVRRTKVSFASLSPTTPASVATKGKCDKDGKRVPLDSRGWIVM